LKQGAPLELHTVKIESIKPHPKNPRIHPDSAIQKLIKSFNEFGWTNPVLISEDKYILAGHARVKAAQEAGITEVPAITLPFKGMSAKAQAYLIADNRLQDETDWDDLKLGELVAELRDLDYDLELAGFNGDEINELLADAPHDEDFECVVDESVPPVTQTGDLIELGRHRLLCGDCTVKENVERLMGGEKAALMVTDPPYGVDYSGKNEFLNTYDQGARIQTEIINDAIKDYRVFFASFLKIVPFSDYNIFYIFMSGKELHNLRLAIDDCVCVCGDYLVWVKNNHVLGRKDYNSKHEFIVYGWKGKHKFYGDFSTTIIECDKPLCSKLHPTMKPIELISKLINDGSNSGFNVYDGFLGSGSTLIAAEQLNRRCYGMEIEPKYCDVIVRRWIEYVGKDKAPADLVERYYAENRVASA
jgi:DNA modification methylase